MIAHVNLDGNGHPGAEIDKTAGPPADLKHRGGIDKHGELRAVNSLDDDLIGADRSDDRALDQSGIAGDRLARSGDERHRLSENAVTFSDGNDRDRRTDLQFVESNRSAIAHEPRERPGMHDHFFVFRRGDDDLIGGRSHDPAAHFDCLLVCLGLIIGNDWCGEDGSR